jgi:hypothetical protein
MDVLILWSFEKRKGGERGEILISDYQFRPGRSIRLFPGEFVSGRSKKGGA